MFAISSDNEDFTRLQVDYKNKSDKFLLHHKDFLKQFYHIYISRLNHISGPLKDSASKKLNVPIIRLCDLREEKPQKCVIIGTLIKHHKLKANLFDELTAENRLVVKNPDSKYWSEEDKIFLEDELNRIELVGEKIDINSLVTGVVAAVQGYEGESGQFEVEDIFYYNPKVERPLKSLKNHPLVVIISGIDQSSQTDFSLSINLFQQWIFGNLDGFGGGRDYEAASIVRVIFAGNSVRSTAEVRKKGIKSKMPDSLDELKPVKRLDTILASLSRSVNVDILPGPYDPSNMMIPQQPMHLCMFPEASKTRNFNSVPNPYYCEIAERNILGTAGQNIHDIQKYANLTALEALESTLKWGHLAPTCPDSLPCYPFTGGEDPLIIDDQINLYYAGNCEKFETKLVGEKKNCSTRLVCVPTFHKSQSIAVVDLNTLDCKEISFKINCFGDMEE